MPSVFSKVLEAPISYIPPKWALFFMKLTNGQKYSIVAAFVMLTVYLMKRRKKNGKAGLKRRNAFGASVNKEFFQQMKFLLKIMIPSLGSSQVALILAHTAVLSAKTFLSIYVATLEGSIIREIVSRYESCFLDHCCYFFFVGTLR